MGEEVVLVILVLVAIVEVVGTGILRFSPSIFTFTGPTAEPIPSAVDPTRGTAVAECPFLASLSRFLNSASDLPELDSPFVVVMIAGLCGDGGVGAGG